MFYIKIKYSRSGVNDHISRRTHLHGLKLDHLDIMAFTKLTITFTVIHWFNLFELCLHIGSYFLASMKYNISFAGRNTGCVGMATGRAAGLWDVRDCNSKAKYICRTWAAGATSPPVIPTTVPATCSSGWKTYKNSKYCYQVSQIQGLNLSL